MTDEPIEVIEARAESLHAAQEHLLESLVELRVARGLSQDTVATRMGVSQPTVSAFERYDANPTLASVRRYALAVGARLKIDVVKDDVEARPTPAARDTSTRTRGHVDLAFGPFAVIVDRRQTHSIEEWADAAFSTSHPGWSGVLR